MNINFIFQKPATLLNALLQDWKSLFNQEEIIHLCYLYELRVSTENFSVILVLKFVIERIIFDSIRIQWEMHL